MAFVRRISANFLSLSHFFTVSLRYVQPPVISFEAIFDQSSPNSPIVFILSPGSEPASDLMKLAKRSGFGANRLKFLAMGQGQEKVNVHSHKYCYMLYATGLYVIAMISDTSTVHCSGALHLDHQ